MRRKSRGARGKLAPRLLAAVLTAWVVAVVVLGATRAEAYVTGPDVPTESIGTAARNASDAIAGDTTLSSLSAELSNPTLQYEFERAAAAVSALNSTYAGGSTSAAQSILSNPTFLADEPAIATQTASGINAVAAGSAPEALAGAEVMDTAAAAGVVGGLETVASAVPVVALGTGIALVGSKIVSELSDPVTLPPAPAYGGAVAVQSERWKKVTLPATKDGTTASTVTGDTSSYPSVSPTVPGRDTFGTSTAYVLEPQYGGTWYGSATGWKPDAGGFTAPDVNANWIDPGDPAYCGAAPGSYLSGWPPTVPNATMMFGGSWNLVCRHDGSSPWVLAKGVGWVRSPAQMKLSLPRAGGTCSGCPSAAQHPLATKTDLYNAIRGLATALNDGRHANARQLLDATNGTKVGGATVTLPGTLEIPAPGAHELATDYVTRLQTAGFTNVSTVTLSDTLIDTTRGPNEAVRTSPASGTAQDPATAIRVYANPDSAAPVAGSGADSGSPSIDFTPITANGSVLCDKFPFGVPCWVLQAINRWSATAAAPTFDVPICFGSDCSRHIHVDLAVIEPAMVILRPILVICATLLIAWTFFGAAIGGRGPSGGGDD